MKRYIPALLILLFVFTHAVAQSGSPNMVIDQPVFDAGLVVRSGEPIEHAFRIKNAGAAELKIFDVKPG